MGRRAGCSPRSLPSSSPRSALDVLLNQWRNRFYNALQEKDWDGFTRETIIFTVIATISVVVDGLSALSQPVAPDPLAQLDDHPISRRMAARRQPLPHAAARRRRRQPRPAHRPTTSRCSSSKHWTSASTLLNSIVTFFSFVIILWGLSNEAPLHLFGSAYADSRLSGLGRTDLFDLRHRADAVDRLPARQSRFRAAAPRGGFPLQPGAHARKLRADRPAAAAKAPSARGCSAASAASSRTGTPS